MKEFILYNTLSRQKEIFKPLNPSVVGIYVCGPTVYGEAHLGHARPSVTYDVLVRLLRHIGYRVRYVRNITDVGHLENDADEGEDKISKKARIEQLEPMEIVQQYTISYHEAMKLLNSLPPNIEPRASGHIIEQIEMAKKIQEHGLAYESNGSLYFDVAAYDKKYKYGVLSGRLVEDLRSNTRSLDGQGDKRSPYDFALWKRASPEHIMRWPSPWSDGFPGWHLECSAMSSKYLGDEFDIHGGGMDLLFPHHECELAQNKAAIGKGGARYWMHNNMITINGQKMGKSLGNYITLKELFTGDNELLDHSYSPMTIRFFMLQAHYRSPLDFSNEALQAAEKGVRKMMQAAADVEALPTVAQSANGELSAILDRIYKALLDDLNTPIAIAEIFDAVRIVNQVKDGHLSVSDDDKLLLKIVFQNIVGDVLGLQSETGLSDRGELISGLMSLILDVRQRAKFNKDFATSDKIRDNLKEIGVTVKDTKEGSEWSL